MIPPGRVQLQEEGRQGWHQPLLRAPQLGQGCWHLPTGQISAESVWTSSTGDDMLGMRGEQGSSPSPTHYCLGKSKQHNGMRIKGLFLTWLPSFPSRAHVSFPHKNPGRSLSPCQPGLALVPRELCPWRAAPCISTKQRRPPAWGTTSPRTGKHAQGTFIAPVDSSAPGSDM